MRKISKEEKAVAESHTMWAIDIHKRNERYSDDSNWNDKESEKDINQTGGYR